MTVREPKKRSNLRLKLGGAYFSAQRKLRWLSMRKHFARERSGEDLAYQAFSHHTPLMRKLKDVDMQLQRNKVTNLRLACARLDGLLLRPGETMSYWYLIGKPTAGKGYLPGMILRNGGYLAATGGGLCQLSNLISKYSFSIIPSRLDLSKIDVLKTREIKTVPWSCELLTCHCPDLSEIATGLTPFRASKPSQSNDFEVGSP